MRVQNSEQELPKQEPVSPLKACVLKAIHPDDHADDVGSRSIYLRAAQSISSYNKWYDPHPLTDSTKAFLGVCWLPRICHKYIHAYHWQQTPVGVLYIQCRLHLYLA